MSEQIDWSNAPEGATHYYPSTEEWYLAGYGCAPLVWTGMWCKAFKFAQREHKCIKRPATPSLSGEGLPPVGVKVLIMNPEEFAITDYGQEFVGEECTLRAVFVNDLDYRMVAVEKVGGACCCFLSEMCFPIRTPEQIAAELTDQAIKEIAVIICRDGAFDIDDPEVTESAVALYDAGYRKEQK